MSLKAPAHEVPEVPLRGGWGLQFYESLNAPSCWNRCQKMSHSSDSSVVTERMRKERLELLKELHRPLEEHWAGNHHKLDALSSDYTYKHHITRLEGIYNSKKFKEKEKRRIDNVAPKGPTNVSPQSQMFGIDGIASMVDSERGFAVREQGWDPYFPYDINAKPLAYSKKYAITEKRIPPPSPASRSSSPIANRNRDNGTQNNSNRNGNKRPSSASANRSRPSSARDRGMPPQPQSQLRNAQNLDGPGALDLSHWGGFDVTMSGADGRFVGYDGGKDQQQEPHHHRHHHHHHNVDKFNVPIRYSSHMRHHQSASAFNHHHDEHPERKPLPVEPEIESNLVGYRCDADLPKEMLVMYGLYSLDEQQKEVFSYFVELLSSFDNADQLKILEDAYKAAQSGGEIFHQYQEFNA